MQEQLKFDPNTDEHLEYVLKRAYRYALGDMTISSNEIQSDICNALCNLIGDDTFVKWNESEEAV
ncbi:MAG: hypothetical protein Q7U57_09540 [Methylovulum sp.]|nr:hypothetical protein [Methylovulum sp.]